MRKPPPSAYKTGRPTRPTYTGELHRDYMEEDGIQKAFSGVQGYRAAGGARKNSAQNKFVSHEGSEGQGEDPNNGVEAGTMLSEPEGIEIKTSHKRISIRTATGEVNPDQAVTPIEAKMKQAALQWNRLKVQRPILA